MRRYGGEHWPERNPRRSRRLHVSFRKGQRVRVIEGPFTNFSGMVEEVNAARGKPKVLVSVVGREDAVEFGWGEVERL